MAWTHDGKGMFYNSYPQQDGKSDGMWRLQESTFPQEVWLPMTKKEANLYRGCLVPEPGFLKEHVSVLLAV
jgi:hypothetical protein